jgi:hypothetical protein
MVDTYVGKVQAEFSPFKQFNPISSQVLEHQCQESSFNHVWVLDRVRLVILVYPFSRVLLYLLLDVCFQLLL